MALLFCIKADCRYFLTGVVHSSKQTRHRGEYHFLRHGDVREHKDVFQLLLRLKQTGQVLLSVIKHHDLIAGIFLEEEKLGRISCRVVGHGIDPVNELQQNPDSQDDPLIRLRQGIDPHVVAARHIGDHQFPLEPADDPLRLVGRLVFEQANHLRLGQSPVLGQPAYDVLLFLQ